MSITPIRSDTMLNTKDTLIKTEARYTLHDGTAYTGITERKHPLVKSDKFNAAELIFGHTLIITKDRHLSRSIYWKFIGLVFILILYVTMVYGPIAAFLVEMFPTKIRYTSMSLPYHIGNGVFGGLVPFIGLLLTTTFTIDPLVGLWYPIGVATLCFIIGTLYLRNKIDKDVTD